MHNEEHKKKQKRNFFVLLGVAFCAFCTTNRPFLGFLQRFSLRTLPSLQPTWLGGELVQLIQSDGVCGEDGGYDVASTRAEDIAMRAWDLLNEVVRAKHSQLAR